MIEKHILRVTSAQSFAQKTEKGEKNNDLHKKVLNLDVWFGGILRETVINNELLNIWLPFELIIYRINIDAS